MIHRERGARARRTARCIWCRRRIAISNVATDLQGRFVLVWHYNREQRECRGASRAAYRDEA